MYRISECSRYQFSSIKLRAGVLLFFIFVCAGILQAGSLNLPMTVKEVAGVGAAGYPVSTVVPFAQGDYQKTSSLRIVDANGNTIPAQFEVLNRWWNQDNSIRHIVAHFQPTVSAFTKANTGKTEYFLKDDGGNSAPSSRVTVTDGAKSVVVNSGAISFTINKVTINEN